MSLESDLDILLTSICPRVYPDIAEPGAQAPYIVWQGIGGESLRFVEGTAADKRNVLVQIGVWATTRKASNEMSQQIEDVLCASAVFSVTPQGEPSRTVDPATSLRGSTQRFDVWAAR